MHGKALIGAFTAALEEMSPSNRKMFSYCHFYPNTNTIWLRYTCFDCNEQELEW